MKRLECLDGLRGLLAMYVLVGHMAPFAVLPAWVQSLVSHGGAAVDVFFVLSGLVITKSLDRVHGEAVPFLYARAARIFPVYLPVFAFAVLVQPASCGFEQMPWVTSDSVARTICVRAWPNAWAADVMAHLTMTHGLFPNSVMPDTWVSFLGSSWSLSTEWQFYLLALIIAGAGASRARRHGGGVGKLAAELLLLGGAGAAWNWTVPEGWQFSRAFLGNEAHFFALGVASMGVVYGRRGALPLYAAILALNLIICGLAGRPAKILPPLVWTLCLAAEVQPVRSGLRQVAWLLRCRTAQRLGAISYCVYITNEPIQKILAAVLSRLADGNAVVFTTVWLPGAVALPVLTSVWLHRCIEMPALRWGHGAATAWTRAHAGAAAD